MALGVVQQLTSAGVLPNYQTPLTTETIVASDRLFLHVKNASGGTITVTIDDVGTTPAGSAAIDPVISVTVSGNGWMIALPQTYANPATGLISVTFSATASVTAAVMRGI